MMTQMCLCDIMIQQQTILYYHWLKFQLFIIFHRSKVRVTDYSRLINAVP
jgi:hypothetical protein